MKKRISKEEIIGLLRKAETVLAVNDLCRRLSMANSMPCGDLDLKWVMAVLPRN
jgi:hypothetical protein